MAASIDLSVAIGSMRLQNPVLTASGTFGYAKEFAPYMDLNTLGGVVTKGISIEPRIGNPPPRIIETPCGMLNAIGLENVGVERFINEKMEFLRQLPGAVIVNILGDTIEEYAALAGQLDVIDGIDALEVNISCPNVKAGGVAFGTEPRMAAAVTRAVKEAVQCPVVVKLSPNVTDIVEIALAVQEAGADGVSLINTLLGMAIDVQRRRPVLGNTMGGLSGPAIKPVALRMVYQVARAVDIPVIGIGGISSTQDVLEFIIAGASAVQIGTANFVTPGISQQIAEGLEAYIKDNDLQSIKDLIGSIES